ncbi:hypothetical protein [Kitasatospora sp. NPDC088783]|uniref:hypothetical protein n=1 Tax=Kitasatospora sp. NPDC088783 TaxID=3364077 RepID=UPI003813C99B
MQQFGLKVGGRVVMSGSAGSTEAVVVGEFEPLDGSDDLWRELPLLNSQLQPSIHVRYGQAMEARGSRTLDATWAFWTAEQPCGTGGTSRRAGELSCGEREFGAVLALAVSVCGGVVSDRFPCPAGTRTMGVPKLIQLLSALVGRLRGAAGPDGGAAVVRVGGSAGDRGVHGGGRDPAGGAARGGGAGAPAGPGRG